MFVGTSNHIKNVKNILHQKTDKTLYKFQQTTIHGILQKI